jgi:hypothetical protein
LLQTTLPPWIDRWLLLALAFLPLAALEVAKWMGQARAAAAARP